MGGSFSTRHIWKGFFGSSSNSAPLMCICSFPLLDNVQNCSFTKKLFISSSIHCPTFMSCNHAAPQYKKRQGLKKEQQTPLLCITHWGTINYYYYYLYGLTCGISNHDLPHIVLAKNQKQYESVMEMYHYHRHILLLYAYIIILHYSLYE